MERTGKQTRDRANGADGVTRSTGRSRQEWFALLDEWGATGRPYREIADWLTRDQGLSAWWAQKLIVEYEQARGIRPPGARRNGTFEVGSSKVIAAPVADVRAALGEQPLREWWLAEAPIEMTDQHPDQRRFDWPGGSRVTVMLAPVGDRKTQVAVRHDRIADAESAERLKAFWRERLEALKAHFER